MPNQKPSSLARKGFSISTFPDGKRIRTLDLSERILVIEDPKTGESKTVRFDYKSEGGHIMSVAVAPDGSVCGGTAFPFLRFSL